MIIIFKPNYSSLLWGNVLLFLLLMEQFVVSLIMYVHKIAKE